MIDLHSAAERTSNLVTSVADDQLGLPTPCPAMTVGDLIDHIGTFADRFTAAARKDVGDRSTPPPPPSGANLEAGWRGRIERDLAVLADAWGNQQAWEGITHAGGLEMPAEVVGLVALDELVVHGWDLAAATGRNYDPAEQEVDAAAGFVSSFAAPRDGRLFGPVVPIADSARPLDRLLGLTGRDPSWQPSA